MARTGIRNIRAAFVDATSSRLTALAPDDPPPEHERNGTKPGQWPGNPADRLPPGCPVVPLGVDGKTAYFIDSIGQLIAVAASEWGKKIIVQLFAGCPNFPYWAWPRWNAKTMTINGMSVDDAHQCLVKAAAARGLFTPQDRVRGRGAWTDSRGELLWHAGDAVYWVDAGKLKNAYPGEHDRQFYPQRPPVATPWSEPVSPETTPAHDLLAALRSWHWERPTLDPILVLGWIGCAFLGAALPWRPHLFATGDKGVGKSTLQFAVKGVLGDALHACADTTAAGIYQRVQTDCLPVAIDELEAAADNKRVMAVVGLARLAASGALMYRGGADHTGTEFRLSNAFFFSSINPPPLEPQDRSRLAIVNMGRIPLGAKRREVTLDADVTGRMILRQLMDSWRDFARALGDWKASLQAGGVDARGQDTYGTLLAVAELILGAAAMEEAGLPVTEQSRLGEMVARWTASDRAEALDNWRACLERLLGSQIDAWRSGEKPTVGSVLEQWEAGVFSLDDTNHRLTLAGLKALERPREDGRTERLLAVPISSPGLEKLYQGTKWGGGVWGSALKQGPLDVVIRDRGNGQNVKINRMATRCLFVDLPAYDRAVHGG